VPQLRPRCCGAFAAIWISVARVLIAALVGGGRLFPPAPGGTEELDEGAVTPVLVLPKFPTALFSVLEEPSVFAVPKLLPVVPWLLALLAFGPDAPPVPFTVAPLLRVVPVPDDVPPVEAPGEPPAELPEDPPAAPPADPPALPPAPPPPPLLCASAQTGDSRAATRSILHESEDDMAKNSVFTLNALLNKAVPKERITETALEPQVPWCTLRLAK
jgi:hypothetical protein